MTDIIQTAALLNLVGQIINLLVDGQGRYGLVKFASARRIVVHFTLEGETVRRVFTPIAFCDAALINGQILTKAGLVG